MSPRQDLARMLRRALLDDAQSVMREHRERTAPAIAPEPAPPPQEAASIGIDASTLRKRAIVHAPSLAVTQPRSPITHTPQTPLTRARELLARYLSEPAPALDTLILWALHTHAHARFTLSPRLILHGRDPHADHARALRILRWLTPAPRLVARATAANVLDLIAQESPSLLLDDAANAILARRDMRALIAAGAYADGALLGRRTRKKDGAARRCAAPVAIATAVSPPEEVLTHAIVLPMAPALREGEGRARPPIAEPPPEILALREAFERIGASLKAKNAAPVLTLPAFLSPATAETWTPMFVCAQALGPDALTAVRAAASQFAHPDHLEPPTSPRALLRDIRRIAGVDGTHASSTRLVEALTREPDSPWNACDYGTKLTPRGIAQRLARFDLRPQVIHLINGTSFRGYKAEALLTAFARYLNDPVARAVLHAEGQEE